MKSNFKKVMSLVLTVLMVLTAVPLSGLAADECAHDFSGVAMQMGDSHAFKCLYCNIYGVGSTANTMEPCYGGTANCTEKAVCEGCWNSYGSTINDAHDYTGKTQKYLSDPATCISQARYYYTCTRCGVADFYGETYGYGPVDATTGHWGEAVANDDGTHDIVKCEGCSLAVDNVPCVGSGANCQEKATCWQCGQKYGDVDATAHVEIVWKDAEAATCQVTGHNGYYYCVACKVETSEKEVLPQLDHTYTDFEKDADADTHSKYCTTCDETVGEVSVITEACKGGTANCTTKATCEVCKAEYGDVKHTWNDGEVTEEPTCSATGLKVYDCTVDGCEETKEEILAISEGAHKWGTELHKEENQKHYVVCEYNAEHKNHINCTATTTVVTAPTCEADGYTTYTCACGNTWTGAPTNALGHNCTKRDTDKNVLVSEATCQKKAVYYYACANCDKSAKDIETCIDKTYETGEKLAHSWDDGVVTTPATCVAKGEKLFTCTTCNADVATVETKTEEIGIDANAHDWNDWTVTAEDKHKRVCKLSDTHVEEEACAGGTATCTAKAVCSVCEDTYGELGAHAYTEEIVDDAHKKSEATCIAKATYWFDCAACDKNAKTDTAAADKFFETGDFKAHDFTKKDTSEAYILEAAACEVDAKYWYACTQEGCTASSKSDSPKDTDWYVADGTAPGHDIEYFEGKDPTCTEDGYTDGRKCKTCGTWTKEQAKREALGHEEYISVEKLEATCTKAGHSEEKKCARCGILLSLPSFSIPALNHEDADEDQVCDREGCGTIMPEGGCSCMCHQTGFMKVIYFLVSLIWKLIGANKYCDCGIEHY